jgi:hypothetical protein
VLNRVFYSEIKKSYTDKMANDLIQNEEIEKNQRKKNSKKKKKIKKKAKNLLIAEESKKEISINANNSTKSPGATVSHGKSEATNVNEIELKEIIVHEMTTSQSSQESLPIHREEKVKTVAVNDKFEEHKSEGKTVFEASCKYCQTKACEIHQYTRNFTSSLKENCLKSIKHAEKLVSNEAVLKDKELNFQESSKISVTTKKNTKKEKKGKKQRTDNFHATEEKRKQEGHHEKRIMNSDGEQSTETKMISAFLNEQEKTEEDVEEENKSVYSVSSLIDDTNKSVPKKRCTSASQSEKDKKRRKGKSQANYLVEESESTTVRERSHSRSNKEADNNSLVVLEDLFDLDKKKVSKSKKKKIKKKMNKKGNFIII